MHSIYRTFLDNHERIVESSAPRSFRSARKPVLPRSIHSPSGAAVVHLAYDINNIPPKPDDPLYPSYPTSSADTTSIRSGPWTRFICISDTHSVVDFPIPNGDVLLHAGDLSTFGRVEELAPTMAWLCRLPHPVKIIIAGNHDLTLDMDWYESNYSGFHGTRENPLAARDLVRGHRTNQANLIYLEYQAAHAGVPRTTRTEQQPPPLFAQPQQPSSSLSASVAGSGSGSGSSLPDGHGHGGQGDTGEAESYVHEEEDKVWKFYGSPGSPWFGGWAFNYERGEAAQELHSMIPSETEIILTHGPPATILDEVAGSDKEHVGCEDLLARIKAVRPRLHVFGHIHEGHGAVIHSWGAGEDEGEGVGEGVEGLDEGACAARETVFVNAACQPSGSLATEAINDGYFPDTGGYNFQPVIVDLLNYDPPVSSAGGGQPGSRVPSTAPSPFEGPATPFDAPSPSHTVHSSAPSPLPSAFTALPQAPTPAPEIDLHSHSYRQTRSPSPPSSHDIASFSALRNDTSHSYSRSTSVSPDTGPPSVGSNGKRELEVELEPGQEQEQERERGYGKETFYQRVMRHARSPPPPPSLQSQSQSQSNARDEVHHTPESASSSSSASASASTVQVVQASVPLFAPSPIPISSSSASPIPSSSSSHLPHSHSHSHSHSQSFGSASEAVLLAASRGRSPPFNTINGTGNGTVSVSALEFPDMHMLRGGGDGVSSPLGSSSPMHSPGLSTTSQWHSHSQSGSPSPRPLPPSSPRGDTPHGQAVGA